MAIRLGQGVEISPQLCTADAQQGPDERGVAQRPAARHPGQAADARAAKDAVQDRFGLVVGRVGGDDEPCAEPAGGRFQEPIAGRSGGGFQPSPDRTANYRPRRVPLRTSRPAAAQIDDESLVVVGVRSQLMVEMGGAMRPAPPVFSAAIARNSATLSLPRKRRPRRSRRAHSDGGHASASLDSSGWSHGAIQFHGKKAFHSETEWHCIPRARALCDALAGRWGSGTPPKTSPIRPVSRH